MSDPLNELLIIGPLIAKIQVANILDWVSPLFSNVIYRDGGTRRSVHIHVCVQKFG